MIEGETFGMPKRVRGKAKQSECADKRASERDECSGFSVFRHIDKREKNIIWNEQKYNEFNFKIFNLFYTVEWRTFFVLCEIPFNLHSLLICFLFLFSFLFSSDLDSDSHYSIPSLSLSLSFSPLPSLSLRLYLPLSSNCQSLFSCLVSRSHCPSSQFESTTQQNQSSQATNHFIPGSNDGTRKRTTNNMERQCRVIGEDQAKPERERHYCRRCGVGFFSYRRYFQHLKMFHSRPCPTHWLVPLPIRYPPTLSVTQHMSPCLPAFLVSSLPLLLPVNVKRTCSLIFFFSHDQEKKLSVVS